jgi:phosphoribosylanthranilate isomerase
VARIKICGLTSIAEAKLVQHHGADAVGLLVGRLHRAPDFIEPDLACAIASTVAPFVTPVLVTHLEDPEEICRLAGKVPCPVVQLHSDLPVSLLRELRKELYPRKIIGKISVESHSALARAAELEACVDALLLDSIDRSTNRVGGTGRIHDWSISAKIVAATRIPVILAGGLTPANVAQAITQVRPWAVDVNSGVETETGAKSEDLVARFVRAVNQTA